MTFAAEFSTAWRGVRIEQSELRLGWITFWWCRASVSNELGRYRAALAEAAKELKPR
jgi:hypothetical protein